MNPPTNADSATIERAPPSLFTGLKASYQDKGATERLTKSGYLQDTSLSDHRQQVWYNPNEKKLLMSVAGSHTAKDFLVTDVALAFGQLKKTKRFQSAQKTLEKAKLKYETPEATIIGHSLGGSIAQKVAGKNDKVYAVDAGFAPFERANSKHTVIRRKGDIVSMFGKNQQTVGKNIVNPLYAHRLKKIKGLNYTI